MNEIQIENALHSAAPVLSDALQAQILRQCRLIVEARERKYRRTQRTLWGAVFAVCALHWLVVGQLDAQNAPRGNNSGARPAVRVASENSATPGALMAFVWSGDWREHKFALRGLMGESNDVAR